MRKILILFFITTILAGCGNTLPQQPNEYVDNGNTNTFPDSFYPSNEGFEQKTLLEFKNTLLTDNLYFYQNFLYLFTESTLDKSNEISCYDLDLNKTIWQKKVEMLNNAFTTYPKGLNNKLIVPAKEEILCLDSAGEALWKYKYPNKDDAFLAQVFQNKVIIYSDKKLTCLEAVSGKMLWSCVPKFKPRSYPFITDEKKFIAYINIGNKSVTGYDISNGEELFTITRNEDINEFGCIDNKLVLNCRKSIVVYDVNTNKELWSQGGYLSDIGNENFILTKSRLYYCLDKYLDSGRSYFAFECRDINSGKNIWERKELVHNMIYCNGFIYEIDGLPYSIQVFNSENGELVSTTKITPDTGLVMQQHIYKNKIYAVDIKSTIPVSKDKNKVSYLIEFSR